MVNIFRYFTELRGFYMYFNTINRKIHIGQKIYFKRDHNNNYNSYNKFAAACKILLKGRIGAVTIRHIPR